MSFSIVGVAAKACTRLISIGGAQQFDAASVEKRRTRYEKRTVGMAMKGVWRRRSIATSRKIELKKPNERDAGQAANQCFPNAARRYFLDSSA